MTGESTTLAQLDALLAAIRGYPDPRRAANEWKQAFRLLQKTGLSAGQVAGVIGMRDVAGLAEMIAQLHQPPSDAARPDAPSDEVCAKALQAFRKRLELTILDDESKLGRNPLTTGKESSVAGIRPPGDWPLAVWEELVRQGKLIHIGHGLYNLPRQ